MVPGDCCFYVYCKNIHFHRKKILIIKKYNFLLLGEGPTFGINGSHGAVEKNSINFRKANTTFCLRLEYNDDESYFHVNKKEICKLNAKDNVSWYNFYLGSITKDFTKDEQREISLNGTVYKFSFVHSSIKKEDNINTNQALMIKTNINNVWFYQKNIYWIIA